MGNMTQSSAGKLLTSASTVTHSSGTACKHDMDVPEMRPVSYVQLYLGAHPLNCHEGRLQWTHKPLIELLAQLAHSLLAERRGKRVTLWQDRDCLALAPTYTFHHAEVDHVSMPPHLPTQANLHNSTPAHAHSSGTSH